MLKSFLSALCATFVGTGSIVYLTGDVSAGDMREHTFSRWHKPLQQRPSKSSIVISQRIKIVALRTEVPY